MKYTAYIRCTWTHCCLRHASFPCRRCKYTNWISGETDRLSFGRVVTNTTSCLLEGPVSRKSRELSGLETPIAKLPSPCLEKLIYSHVFNVRKTKRTAKFDGLEPQHCGDIKAIVPHEIGPKSFGTFEEQVTFPRKTRQLFGSEKKFSKLWCACREKLVFYCFIYKERQNNWRVSKFETSSFWRYKLICYSKSFGTFEKRAPGPWQPFFCLEKIFPVSRVVTCSWRADSLAWTKKPRKNTKRIKKDVMSLIQCKSEKKSSWHLLGWVLKKEGRKEGQKHRLTG